MAAPVVATTVPVVGRFRQGSSGRVVRAERTPVVGPGRLGWPGRPGSPLDRGATRGGLGQVERQKAPAVAARIVAQAVVAAMLTHSTAACAPSPAGPNTTVGIPAAAMKAESAQ